MTAPCVGCHTVRGSAALGRLGPDLTHLASRRTLAAGTLSNNAANLEAWITHPQGLKPGVRMPDNFQLTGAERAALVAYLQELRLAGWRLSVMQTEERHAG
jgi:cytochrome c oxidase subunit 2